MPNRLLHGTAPSFSLVSGDYTLLFRICILPQRRSKGKVSVAQAWFDGKAGMAGWKIWRQAEIWIVILPIGEQRSGRPEALFVHFTSVTMEKFRNVNHFRGPVNYSVLA